jgi:hypothetical protein
MVTTPLKHVLMPYAAMKEVFHRAYPANITHSGSGVV